MSLLAELQAKQKARAASVIVPGTTATGSNSSSSAPGSGSSTPVHPAHPPPLGATPAVGPPPLPRTTPPPLPGAHKSASVILTSPPLAGHHLPPPLPHHVPPPVPIRSGPPPPPPPANRPPPPLPPTISTNAGPPPVPPHPSPAAVVAALSPARLSLSGTKPPSPHVSPVINAQPTPPNPTHSHPSITLPHGGSNASVDEDTPTAPDTPTGTGGHRTTRSFSSAAATSIGISGIQSGGLQQFSVSPNPLSPPPIVYQPPSLPLPVLPAFPQQAAGDELPPLTGKNVLIKRQLSEASRQVYLNEGPEYTGMAGGEEDDTPTVEFRLPTAGPIKLSSTVRVHTEVQENRFVDDYVPSIPTGADVLVASALTAFTRPIKAFVRTHVKYHKLPNPNSSHATITRGRDKELVPFDVDESTAQQGKSDKDPGATVKGVSSTSSAAGGASKAGLADLFTNPSGAPTSPSPPPPNAAQTNLSAPTASSSSPALSPMSDVPSKAKEAEIEELSDLSLLHVLPPDALAAVEKDATTFERKEENLFLRSHPEFDYNDLTQRAEYTIGKRLPPSSSTSMWQREFGTHLLMSVASLRIGIGNVEPFFGTLALYDLKLGQRLTEDFHWDLNDNSLLTGQLEVNKSCADPITLSPHGLFSIQDKHSDVVLIIKLERILQGDPAEMEHYFKLKSRTIPEMTTLLKKAKNNLIYLSDYRQTFGWCMLPLFEESGELRNFGSHERGSSFVRIDRIFQQLDSLKDELFIQLIRETRENVSKGGKVYPGCSIDLRIMELDENELPRNRVDVSCIALKDASSPITVTDVSEYNVAADCPLPTGSPASGPTGANAASASRPTITVPPTPMASAAGPVTPSASTPSSAGGSAGGATTPHHSSSASLNQHQFNLNAAGVGSSGVAAGPLAPLHTTTISNNPVPSPPMIREVEEFTDYAPPPSVSATPPTPHTFFVNLLYLYPEFIRFEKYRNIACRIQFRNSDSNVVCEGMKVIRGKSSGSNFTLSNLTQVNYHRKQVTPQDEIKIMLPLNMTSSTHLFFTFYKVSCKTKPGKREIIGMACLPLFSRGRMIVDDCYELPIAAKLPKNYLQPYLEGRETDELHFRHSGQKCFTIRLRLVSSIFSQDEHIYSFLHTFPNSKELSSCHSEQRGLLLHKAIEHIHKLNPWYTIKFLPPLLDYFFELIQNRATTNLPQNNNSNQIQASYYGFLGLTYLVFRISEYYVNEIAASGNRCSILVAYITHRLENLTYPVIMQSSNIMPNAMGAEAAAAAAIGATPNNPNTAVPYVPLYAIFTKLWLIGLNPSATSDSAALFTLPNTSSAVAASLSALNPGQPNLSSPAPSSSSSGSASGGSAGGSGAHQTLHERLLISYAWFYFEVIFKSLVLERDRQVRETGSFQDDTHLLEFLKYFEGLIQVIVQIMYKHRTVGLTSVKHLIHNLALFFNDLFSVLEKHRVIGFITSFLHAFRINMNYADPVLVEMKFTFYHLLLDYEWMMDVCEPESIPVEAPPPVDGSTSVPTQPSPLHTKDDEDEDSQFGDRKREDSNELITRIKAKYPLIALFINDYVTTLARSRESLIREKIIHSMRSFLTKHDYDVRWQSVKADIATMFLPLLPAHLEELELLKTKEEREREKEDGLTSHTHAHGVTAQISSHKAHPTSSSSASSPLSPTGGSSSTASIEEAKLRRNILISVIWVMKNVPMPLLRAWWSRDLLLQSGATAAVSGSSRENSVSERSSDQHNEGPFLDFIYLLDTCVNAFPYVGLHRRESEPDSDVILAPETVATFQGDGMGGVNQVADIKSDIEALMSNIHKTRTLGGGGGTLRAARSSTIGANDKNATIGPGGLSGGGAGAAGGKSTLRQLRAQLSTKNATIGPGGLNMAMLAANAAAIGASGDTLAPPGSGPPAGGTLTGATSAQFASMVTGGTYRAHKTVRGSEFHPGVGGGSKEYVLRLVQWEGYLTRNVAQVIVKVVNSLLEDLHTFLSTKTKWLNDGELVEANCLESLQAVLKLFTSFVASNHANSTLLALYPTILLFLQRYGRFFHQTPQVKKVMGTFASISFRICAFASREVRTHAVALTYSLLLNNYELDHNLFHLQMQLTISLSKLTENLSVTSEKYLQLSILALMRLAAKSMTAPSSTGVTAPSLDFKVRLDTLLGRLSTILSDSMEISRQTKLGSDADSATSENLLVQIADAFSHIPEIRIEWLNRLAHHHQREEQYAEAGQCFILMANLVTSKGSGNEGEGYSMVDSKTSKELDMLVSQYYEAACKMLDKAELYEQCIEVYKLLQPIYHKYLDYKSLSVSHYHCHQVFEKLMDANRKQSRMLGTYYRIGFYGLKFGERLHGNEFLYKCPKITRLSEVATRMKTLYSNQLGCSVKILPDSNPVDVSKLEHIEEECLLQITFVTPSFVQEGQQLKEYEQTMIELQNRQRNTWIEQNTNLQCFKFSTPFTSGGKAFGSVTEQHKRNTILYVRAEFPYILTAQQIVRRQETILSPIASATEDVILRTNSLLELISSDTLNAKVLTGLLAGSVATQVHGGSKEICQAFLSSSSDETPGESPATSPINSPNKSLDDEPPSASPTNEDGRWSLEDQEKLKDAMRSFVDACSLALDANKKLSEKGGTDAEKEFHANLEQQFVELTSVIRPLINKEKKTKKKTKKAGVRFG